MFTSFRDLVDFVILMHQFHHLLIQGDLGSGSEEEEEKSWLEEEKNSFINELDKNKDGFLDRKEVVWKVVEWVGGRKGEVEKRKDGMR